MVHLMRLADTILYKALVKSAGWTDTVRDTHSKLTDVAEDAGTRLGHTLGDMFGRLSTDSNDYEDGDIVQLRNQQEEIALLDRETARLRRLARIIKRKKDSISAAVDRASRSPFI